MVCPKCGGTNIQVVNQQHVSGKVKDSRKVKGFGGCKSCIMTCIIGPLGFSVVFAEWGKQKVNLKIQENIQMKYLLSAWIAENNSNNEAPI